jgi:hypothetical protein
MKKKDSPEQRVEQASLDVIRVETTLSRYPIHRLARQGSLAIELREASEEGKTTLRWQVSHNSEFGQPGPLAYKLDTLVINRRIEAAGSPLPEIVRLGSLKDICRDLGLAESGANTTVVKRALYQNASAFITAKVRYKSADGAERSIEIGDTRYGVVFTGETLPDGRTADGVYIVPHKFYREILDNALARPLDYDYLKELPPAAQRLYEVVSYALFAALRNHRPRARLTYSEFCRLAPLTRYFDREQVRSQMKQIHAPHRKSGYIAGVELESTTDRDGRPDWVLSYTPGPKAKAEHLAFTRRGGQAVLAIEALPTPAAPEPDPEPPALARDLLDRGVTRCVALDLVRDFPEDHIRAQIANLDGRRRKVKDPGAWLASAIRKGYAVKAVPVATPAPTVAPPVVPMVDRSARDRERAARAYWEGLTAEERERIDAEALAHADAETRADFEAETRPALRRMKLSAIRNAYLDAVDHAV